MGVQHRPDLASSPTRPLLNSTQLNSTPTQLNSTPTQLNLTPTPQYAALDPYIVLFPGSSVPQFVAPDPLTSIQCLLYLLCSIRLLCSLLVTPPLPTMINLVCFPSFVAHHILPDSCYVPVLRTPLRMRARSLMLQ